MQNHRIFLLGRLCHCLCKSDHPYALTRLKFQWAPLAVNDPASQRLTEQDFHTGLASEALPAWSEESTYRHSKPLVSAPGFARGEHPMLSLQFSTAIRHIVIQITLACLAFEDTHMGDPPSCWACLVKLTNLTSRTLTIPMHIAVCTQPEHRKSNTSGRGIDVLDTVGFSNLARTFWLDEAGADLTQRVPMAQ